MDKSHHDYLKTYYEYLTRNYIGHLDSDYLNLQKGESPDFKSDKIGLEIVNALTDEEGRKNALTKKYLGKKIEDIPDKFLQSLGFDKSTLYQDNEPGKEMVFI